VLNDTSTSVEPDDDGGGAVLATPRARGEQARVWYAERDRLVGLAYRMLGSVFEAEEVVQEAFLRLYRSQEVEDPWAWLTTVVSRLCLDHLGSARARREVYVGQWLPEPMFTQPEPQDEVALAESVSTAMLVVLETLSPLERVVFVLREAFALEYAEIAAMVKRSAAAVRQLASRARRHVREGRPRFEPDAAQRERVASAFLAACEGADLERLLAVLDTDVVLRSDGGGKAPSPPHAVSGALRVARAPQRPPGVGRASRRGDARGAGQRHAWPGLPVSARRTAACGGQPGCGWGPGGWGQLAGQSGQAPAPASARHRGHPTLATFKAAPARGVELDPMTIMQNALHSGGVPLLVEKRADAGSRSRILRGGGDRLVDHLLLEL